MPKAIRGTATQKLLGGFNHVYSATTLGELYAEALEHIVGGVNSPSRSFKAVGGGAPVFMKRGRALISGMSTAIAILIILRLRADHYRTCPPAYYRSYCSGG